jgi:hypothetical protein
MAIQKGAFAIVGFMMRVVYEIFMYILEKVLSYKLWAIYSAL